MTEDLMLGILIGMGVLGLLLAATHRTYRRTLQHCADCESAEKLPDGNFYYLVREDRYNKLQATHGMLTQINNAIDKDRSDGDTEYAAGVNAARLQHLAIIAAVTEPRDRAATAGVKVSPEGSTNGR